MNTIKLQLLYYFDETVSRLDTIKYPEIEWLEEHNFSIINSRVMPSNALISVIFDYELDEIMYVLYAMKFSDSFKYREGQVLSRRIYESNLHIH